MKKTFLFIALGIITIFCILYGTSKNFGFGNPFEKEERTREYSSSGRGTIEQVLESFSEIRIKTNVMSLTIQEGPQFKAEGSYSKSSLCPQISVKNGVLQVTQHSVQRGISTGTQHCRMVITIPSGTNLSNVDINSSVGDIRLKDLNAEDIDVSLNVGEIEVRKVLFDTIKCDNNVGKISIDAAADLDEYSMSLSTDVGEVRVNGESYKRSYDRRGEGSKRIKVSNNVGEINVR